LSIVVAFLAIVIPILNDYWKSDEQLYSEYKEHFSELLLDSIKIKQSLLDVDSASGIIKLTGIDYWIKLKNNTDDVVSIKTYLTLDYNKKSEFIRDKLRNKDTSFINFVIDSSYSSWVLQSRESRWYQMRTIFNRSTGNITTLHTCILYTNKHGGIYDLYFIQELKYNIEFETPLDFMVDTLKKKIIHILPSKMVEFTENRLTIPPYIYNVSEVNFINDLLGQ